MAVTETHSNHYLKAVLFWNILFLIIFNNSSTIVLMAPKLREYSQLLSAELSGWQHLTY